jgi:hypothetical protein
MRKSALVCVAILAAGAADAQLPQAQVPMAVSTRFDGTWDVTLACADYMGAGVGAKGYTFQFMAQVNGGQLDAQYGKQGSPGSLHYSGRILDDGSADIEATGVSANPEYSVGRVASGTPYAYRFRAKFDGSRGSGTHVDRRPCEATFIKQ